MIKGKDLLLIGGIALGIYYLSKEKDEPKSEDDTSDDNNDLSLNLDSEMEGSGIASFLDQQGKDLSTWVYEEGDNISFNEEAFESLANHMVGQNGSIFQCCSGEDDTTQDERINLANQWLIDREYVNETPEILAYLIDWLDEVCEEISPCDNEVIGEGGRKSDNINFVDGEDDSLLYGEDEFVNLNSNDVFATAEKKIRKFS
tara:strand:- start:52 stop:657 length:606 start_codon:yes stop_codon:yes gene_type:complete